MRRSCLILFGILFSTVLLCQDTTKVSKGNAATYIIPTTLLVSGLILNQESLKFDARNWVRKHYAIPDTRIDDVLQHIPLAMMYIGDLAYQRPTNEVMRQTRHLLVSQGLTLGVVYLLKEVTKEQRPTGGSRSFPSGHTAYSFAGATVFYHAFKDNSKVLAYLGYLPATMTAVYRVLRDKHWVSDVVFGAGIGVLASQLSYHFNIWNSTSSGSKKRERLKFSIGMASNSYGIGGYLVF